MQNSTDLLNALETDCPREHLVLLDPDDRRPYTLRELRDVRRRPFASRWYMSGLNINWKTVWLRTHFSDNAPYTSPTRRIRDLVKATITTGNDVAARSISADILTSFFQMESSEYYSFASMLGSVLTEHGKGVTFETKGDQHTVFMIENSELQELSRLRFTRVMHILLSKVSIERFLVEEKACNIFRIAYCLTENLDVAKGEVNRTEVLFQGYFLSLVAFIIEGALTTYLIAANVNPCGALTVSYECESTWSVVPRMIPLAVMTFILSALLSLPELRNGRRTYRFYNQRHRRPLLHPIAAMDLFSNIILPIVLTCVGFCLILSQEDFIEAVLNSTALLFILEIDDLLPGVLELNSTSIVRNFLITQTLQELEEVRRDVANEMLESKPMEERIDSIKRRLALEGIAPIHFADMMLTNSQESGTDIKESGTFAPYEVKGTPESPSISNSNYITSKCLLSRIEWRYTAGYPLSSKPRIGYLRVWKLGEEEAYVLREVGLRNVWTEESENFSYITIRDPHEATIENHPQKLEAMLNEWNGTAATSTERPAGTATRGASITNMPSLRPPNHDASPEKEKKSWPWEQRETSVNDEETQIKQRNVILDSLKSTYRLEGVYLITGFEMSESILKLRVCGSKSTHHFLAAMEKYSLWSLDSSAEDALNEHTTQRIEKEKAKRRLNSAPSLTQGRR